MGDNVYQLHTGKYEKTIKYINTLLVINDETSTQLPTAFWLHGGKAFQRWLCGISQVMG